VEWAKDPRYINHQARGTNQRDIDARIGEWTKTMTTRQVLDLMDKFGVPAGLIYRPPDMLEDPHFKARDAIVTTQHPHFGDLKMQNVAPKLSETPGGIRSAAPEMGQHNEEVYLKLMGMYPARFDALKSRKVI